MSAETLAQSNKLILGTEGGFSDHPEDPGGPTNKGITLATLTGWWLKRDPNGPKPTVEDLKKLTDEEAGQIFDVQYATPVHYDELPPGIDYAVLDFAVNSGPSRAVQELQQVLGFAVKDQDGVMGSKTLGAVKQVTNLAGFIGQYQEERLAFMKTLKVWGTFKNGWTARVESVEHQALTMAAGSSPAPMGVPGVAKATGSTKLLSSFNGRAAVASLAGVLLTAAGVAGQLSGVLAPFATTRGVSTVLLVCSVLASAVPLLTQLQKAASGANAT